MKENHNYGVRVYQARHLLTGYACRLATDSIGLTLHLDIERH